MRHKFSLHLLLSTLTLCLGLNRDAFAHDPGLSRALVRVNATNVEVIATLGLADVGNLIELERDRNGAISRNALAQAAATIQREADKAFDLKLDGQSIQATHARCSFNDTDTLTIQLDFPMREFSRLEIRSAWLIRLPPGHRQFLTLQKSNGDLFLERLLSASADSVVFEKTAPGENLVKVQRTNSFGDFLLMGVKHIWTGYDHLLFLFGLLIVTRDFKSSVKIITCFTLAHSITLAVATLSPMRIPSRIIEPLIAVSIVYVGLENLWRGDDPKGRWLLTFAFGLIHGFGFASVLRELGVGAYGVGIAVPLISFNLGVELGQITIAALVLPLIWKWRTRPMFIARWIPAASAAVALLGSFWLVQRVWFN